MSGKQKKIGAVIDEVDLQTQHLMEEFSDYTGGVRVVFLLHRGKEGGSNNHEYKRRSLRLITHNEKELKDAIRKCLTLQKTTHQECRVYMTVNPRSLRNGEYIFKKTQLETDFGDETGKRYFYERLEDKWISALVQGKPPKGCAKFILDVDERDNSKALSFCGENHIEIEKAYATKNGWHLIVKPFDVSICPREIADVQKEGLILLSY